MIKQLVNQIMQLIDSGDLLKKPFKWLYVIAGALCFVPFFAFVVCLIWQWDWFMSLVGGNFWTNFVSIFVFILFIYCLFIYAFFGWHYWLNRKTNIDKVIKTDSNVVTIPLIADFNQCCGDINSLFIVLVTCFCTILAFIACMLTDGFGFYSDLAFWWLLLGGIVLIAVAALIAYLNTLLVHFVSERIRLLPQISNDIHYLTAKADADKKNIDVAESSKFELPVITDGEKKGGLIAIIAAAAAALIIAFCLSIGNVIAMNKSIFKELDDKRVEKIAEANHDVTFMFFYSAVRTACESSESAGDAGEYEKLKYKRVYKFLSNYYENDELKAKENEKAAKEYDKVFIEPYEEQLNAEVTKWKDYIEKHDPNRYLVLNAKTDIKAISDWWNTIHAPILYFVVDYPLGEISDASVTIAARDKSGKAYATPSTLSLNTILTEFCKSNPGGFATDNSGFWNKYKPVVSINSVTLKDGTVLSAKDMEQVPKSMKNYIDEPSDANKLEALRELSGKEIPALDEYQASHWAAVLQKEDQLCYDFVEKYMR